MSQLNGPATASKRRDALQSGRPLRLAFIASRWDYGNVERGPSFEEMNFRTAFEGMGHHVESYDFAARAAAIGQAAMNDELTRYLLEKRPEIAVFFLFGDEIAPETIRRITDAGITTFNWFADDHWRFESFSRRYAPLFSLVATTDHAAIPKYRAIGCERVVLSQWACNQYSYRPTGRDLQYDVTFVGQRYGDRPKVIEKLRRVGIDVHCWGFGWETGRLSHDEMVDVFESSRINLNLSGAWRGPWWRRRSAVSQIKGRTFEVPGSRGFLLTEQTPHLDEYFAIGHEIAAYDGDHDLVDQIRYWLSHESERAAVVRAGYARVMREHTYDHRFAEIFRIAGLYHA